MIAALQKDDQLLTDIHQAAADQLHLWWLGQSGFLLRWQDHHLLFDPYLSDSLTTKYADTDKPHVRMSERVIDPARLDFIDVVTSSHHHTDHLDADTLRPLFAVNPGLKLVLPAAWQDLALQRTGAASDRLVPMDSGQDVNVGPFSFHAVAAAHNEIEHDAEGRCLYLGYVVGIGPWKIYFSGDTLRYDGMAEQLRTLGPFDIAILPINGNRPERRVAGNLDAVEAARLAHDIGAGVAVPCHYNMFEFNTASPEPFVAESRRLAGTGTDPVQQCERARVLQHGERLSVIEPQRL